MRARVHVGGALACSVAFLVVLAFPGLGDRAAVWVSDGFQLFAAAAAAYGCGVGARRSHGQRRRAWQCLAGGTGAWAAGQAVWSYYEVVLGREVPFPSLADVGFLVFPVLAGVGLVHWLGAGEDQLVARGRDVLDGAIIAVSLLALSWVTTLGAVVAQGHQGPLTLLLSVAYPLGDLLVGTLVLLALARGRTAERTTLLVLTAGLGGLALSDSAYTYLTGTGVYDSADYISGGWVLGFLLVGAAGLSAREPLAATTTTHATGPVVERAALLRQSLPYLPLVAAGIALAGVLLRPPVDHLAELLLAMALVVAVLGRQFLALVDNQRLLDALTQARDALAHQALHDALTGLANRVLFSERLERALLRGTGPVGVLFCDLDNFKDVNDRLGHETGDTVLRLIARRLEECVRTTDTVGRLGGDEFAILLEDSTDAVQVAERIVEAMRAPIEVRGHAVHTTISVGIAHHDPVLATTDGRRTTDGAGVPATAAGPDVDRDAIALLRRADVAMYAAKRAGKSRAVLADEAAARP